MATSSYMIVNETDSPVVKRYCKGYKLPAEKKLKTQCFVLHDLQSRTSVNMTNDIGYIWLLFLNMNFFQISLLVAVQLSKLPVKLLTRVFFGLKLSRIRSVPIYLSLPC